MVKNTKYKVDQGCCCWPGSRTGTWTLGWMRIVLNKYTFAEQKGSPRVVTNHILSWRMPEGRSSMTSFSMNPAWDARRALSYRGHKRAMISCSGVLVLIRRTAFATREIRVRPSGSQRDNIWGTLFERDGPGGNVLASVVDLRPNRSAPLSLRDLANCKSTTRHRLPW